MTIKSIAAVVVAAGLTLGILPSRASTLFSADLTVAGDGLLTLDSATSLQWLDLTATVGQSRATVLGGAYVAQGFRYATQDEVLKLWQDAGGSVTTAGFTHSAADFGPAVQLLDFMGCTSSQISYAVGCAVANGYTENDYWNLGHFGSGDRDVAFVGYVTANPFYSDLAGHGEFFMAYGDEPEANVAITTRKDIGSYLVRAIPVSGVPEPNSWVMMILGFGLIGVVLRMRRRREIIASVTT